VNATSALTHDCNIGPRDDDGVDIQPFVNRLVESLSFQEETAADSLEVVAAFNSANPKAAFRAIVLRRANEMAELVTGKHRTFRDIVKELDAYCHLFEADDRKARKAA